MKTEKYGPQRGPTQVLATFSHICQLCEFLLQVCALSTLFDTSHSGVGSFLLACSLIYLPLVQCALQERLGVKNLRYLVYHKVTKLSNW